MTLYIIGSFLAGFIVGRVWQYIRDKRRAPDLLNAQDSADFTASQIL